MQSASQPSSPEKTDTFNLFLLGTDTNIEEGGATLEGYERGETLNAIYRCLNGKDFEDKHIVSGPVTLGGDTGEKAAEGIWMALKAISEGKKTIKIAAHSRGGIESLLVVHALEEIIKKLKTANIETLAKCLNEIKLGNYMTSNFKMANQKKGDAFTFKTKQKVPDKKAKSGFKEIEKDHSINIENLLANIKENGIACELFVIDPVPGQSTLFVGNWTENEFFEIPAIVKKLNLIYMSSERSKFFEPIVPKKIPDGCKVEMMALPGHHGTASGWLHEQSVPDKNYIADENPKIAAPVKKAPAIILLDPPVEAAPASMPDAAANVAIENQSATVVEDKSRAPSPTRETTPPRSPSPPEQPINANFKGKLTRHVQKLVATKLVEFFGVSAFRVPDEKEAERVSADKIPPITKTIFRRIMRPATITEFKLKLYAKIWGRKSEYSKFHTTKYPVVGYGYERNILVDVKGNLASFNSDSRLHDPLIGYVNDEHIKLSISLLVDKYPFQSDASPKDILKKFSEMFDDVNKNKVGIDNLYGNAETAEKYIAYFYLLVERFIEMRSKSIMDGSEEMVSALAEVGGVILEVNNLQAKLKAYEKVSVEANKKSKKDITRIAERLGETWRKVVDGIAVVPRIHAIKTERSRLLKEAIEKQNADPVRSEALKGLLDSTDTLINGLREMRKVGLIADDMLAKYLDECDHLRDTLIVVLMADKNYSVAAKAKFQQENAKPDDTQERIIQLREASLQADELALQSRKAAVDLVAESLRSEIAAYKQQEKKWQSIAQELEEKAIELAKKERDLELKLAADAAVSDRLRSGLIEIQKGQADIARRHGELSGIERSLEKKRQDIEEMNASKKAEGAAIDVLVGEQKERLSALDKQCEAASQKVKEMKIEIDALKQRKAEILTEISTYEIDAAAAVTLAEEIRKQKDQVSQTQAEMVVLQEQGAEAARVKCESLERWQSDLRAQADEIAKEREALEKQKIAFEQAQVAAKTKDEGSPKIAATGSSASVEAKASKQSDNSGAKSLAEANAKLAAERKALSAEKNELKKANDKEVKRLQRLHDKLEKSRAAYTKANQAMKSREDKVKAEEEMLSRRHPLIQQLDDAILSMPVSSDSSAGDDNPQVIFSVALTNLRQTLKVDIDQQLAAGKSNIAASAAGRIAIETKVMLEKLRIEGNDRIQVLRDYENKCKHSSLGSKLLKAIGAVCIAAVGFVIGAVIGLTVGMLAGACSGPGAFVTAALGMTTGAAIGMYVAAGGVGVAAGISSGFLLFSHGRVTKQAIATARVGMEAYTPRVLAK